MGRTAGMRARLIEGECVRRYAGRFKPMMMTAIMLYRVFG